MDSDIQLKIVRASNTEALHSFYCGQAVIDDIIHNSLKDTLPMHDLFLVRIGDEVIALYCIAKEKHAFFIPDDTKEMMLKGIKPIPEEEKETILEEFNVPAIEISLLAVKEEYRDNDIGSFLIEHIIDGFTKDPNETSRYVVVRAINTKEYSAIGFYRKCGFYPSEKEKPDQNLFMYRVIS